MKKLYKNFPKVVVVILLTLFFSCQNKELDRNEVRKKVGQLFLLAFSGDEAGPVLPFIKERGIGGLYLSNENLGEPEKTAILLNQLQKAAINGASGLPLLTAADQEGAWGVMVPYSSTGPGNMALGASKVENTSKMYSVFAKELAAVGVFCNLSPAADVNSNPLNPIIGTRSFGEGPQKVSKRVEAAILGLHDNNIIATAKHFPGHGNTATDSHSGIPKVSRSAAEIEAIDLLPFKTAINAGVDIVMTSHIIYDALDTVNPATLSPKILNDLLRKKLGFKGVIITDSFNMNAIQKNYVPAEAAITALLAGADMIMLAEERYGEDVGNYIESQNRMLDKVEQAVLDGRIPMSRINEAYNRIVSLKQKYKLSERIPVDPKMAKEIIGSKANKNVALKCAEDALVIVYDNKQLIPLQEKAPISIVKLTKESVEEIVTIGGGIGPNYATAYNDFVTEMKLQGFVVNEYNFDDENIPEETIIIAVSENYPFAGLSLDQKEQRRRLAFLIENNKQSDIVNAALKDPYDAFLVKPDAYVSALGSNISNVKAMANLLAGKVKATGTLPVTPIKE